MNPVVITYQGDGVVDKEEPRAALKRPPGSIKTICFSGKSKPHNAVISMDFIVESFEKQLPAHCILGWLTLNGVSLNTSKIHPRLSFYLLKCSWQK